MSRLISTVVTVIAATLLGGGTVYAAQPPIPAGIAVPRVPPEHLAEARGMQNPLRFTAAAVLRGKRAYLSFCSSCHGKGEEGKGPRSKALKAAPRNFHLPEFHRVRTDGELYWVIKYGSRLTKDMPAWGRRLTDETVWSIVFFLRTLPIYEGVKGSDKKLPIVN